MKKWIAILLALALVLALAACQTNTKPEDANTGGPEAGASPSPASPSPSDEPPAAASDAPEETPDAPEENPASLHVAFLSGPTGIGAAKFMEQAEADALFDDYTVALETDPTAVVAALISGELDIAAVPTNVAATLYNKTQGNVKLAAINTLGVLYILENGDTVQSVADLAGKTVLATGQGSNPEFVLNYILAQNGLTPGEDLTVEYLASDEVVTRMVSGNGDVCMLPVPAATTVAMKNADVRFALSLTDEWAAASGDGSVLTQGCIAVRTDKVDTAALARFLEAYAASIAYMTDPANLDGAAALAVKFGIVGNETVAAKAIPDCNMVCITGAADMRAALGAYYTVLLNADPTSIGGAVPNDDFYLDVPAA